MISHSLFVEDTLMLCKDSFDEMLYLSWVLFYFEVVSGLKVNLEKRVIFPVGNAVNIEMLASELGCRAWTLLSIIRASLLAVRETL